VGTILDSLVLITFTHTAQVRGGRSDPG